MVDPLDIAMSHGAETERNPTTGKILTSEDRRRLAQKKAAGDRNEVLVAQRQILGFNKSPNNSGEVADDDEWGECAVVKRKPWVDCLCRNPVENQGDAFCKVCIARAGREEKNRVDLSRDDEWTQEFRRMLIAESEQEGERNKEKEEEEERKKGIARSRGAETERELRSSERLTSQDRMRLAKEAGGQKRGLILDLVNPPTSDDAMVDDDAWGGCRVVPREPWVDCPCGNPVEIRGDTLCEVCRILDVPRRIEISRTRRRDVEVEGEEYLYSEAPNTREYDSERKHRRARERGVELLDRDNDANQSAVVSRIRTNDQANYKGKEKQDVRNEKERGLFDIPSNLLDQAEPMLLRSEGLSLEIGRAHV